MAKYDHLTFSERLTLSLFGPVIGQVYEAYLSVRDACITLSAALQGKSHLITDFNELNPKSIALVATQAGKSVPKSIEVAIDLLFQRDVSVLLVCNGAMSPELKERLGQKIWRSLERPNTGRDYGAYQAGVLHLMTKNIVPDQLIVLNDSMFYDRVRAGPMFDKVLKTTFDFVAATENHDPIYHVGSFFFAVSSKVQKSSAWIKYWKNYYPSSSRPHAIAFGEVGMSKALIQKGGFLPKILYSTNDVAEIIRNWTVEDLAKKWILFPKEFRLEVNGFGLKGLFESQNSLRLGGDIAQLESLPDIVSRAQSREILAVKKIGFEAIVDQLISKMEIRSQVHWAGLLMVDLLDLGIIKKDFTFRGLYEINHFSQAIAQVAYPDLDEVSLELRKRGSPISIRGVRRLLYDAGHI
jgi:Rhamnan synthesis protein F